MLLSAAATGQALPEWLAQNSGKKPPDFGVLDESGFFNGDTGTLRRISDQIRALEEAHGFKIYLVVEPVLIASSAPELAAELRQAWVPDGNGMVVVLEADSRTLGIGRDMAGDPMEESPVVRIPSHEMDAILSRAMTAVDAKLAPAPYLEALVGSLASEVGAYFKRRAAPPPPQRSMKIGLLVTGTLALLGLGAIAAGGLARQSGMAGTRVFRFPPVDRPERLGAPCGSQVTARRFARRE